MKIRLGYACISETLGITTSKTYPYSMFEKEQNLQKLDQIIQKNLANLKEILLYNSKNNIHFYRMSSGLIPLATKQEVSMDYQKKYEKQYQELATIIEKQKMRVDFHPNEYCVLSSAKEEVRLQSIEILKYHSTLLKQLKIEHPHLILHIGSSEFGKEQAMQRFIHTFRMLPKEIQKMIVIENDDKIYNIKDCLELSKKLHIPVVLDYHHHLCNGTEEPIEEFLDEIIKSWKGEIPKMHFSSPKSKQKKEYRAHHDYIDVDCFLAFLNLLKPFRQDIDIMIEAKKKDEAMFRLIRILKYKTEITFFDDTTLILKKK